MQATPAAPGSALLISQLAKAGDSAGALQAYLASSNSWRLFWFPKPARKYSLPQQWLREVLGSIAVGSKGTVAVSAVVELLGIYRAGSSQLDAVSVAAGGPFAPATLKPHSLHFTITVGDLPSKGVLAACGSSI
jgi:hypothetical protein